MQGVTVLAVVVAYELAARSATATAPRRRSDRRGAVVTPEIPAELAAKPAIET